MKKYHTLMSELDRCEYIVDFQYTGTLEGYSYNGITYEQSSETYAQILNSMYLDFLAEWSTLSETERDTAHEMFELIVSKRYINGVFFFDTPSQETITSMSEDSGVPQQSVDMARFLLEMSRQQQFYLERLKRFMNGTHHTDTSTIENISVDDACSEVNTETEYPDAVTVQNIYQELHAKYGDTMSVKQLCEFFKVVERTIYTWERKGYLSNISVTSEEKTSAGHKKRGDTKLYLTYDIAQNVEMQRKFNKL